MLAAAFSVKVMARISRGRTPAIDQLAVALDQHRGFAGTGTRDDAGVLAQAFDVNGGKLSGGEFRHVQMH